MSEIAIPIRTDLVAQMILRSEGRKDPVGMIADIIENYLERTLGDPDIWSEKHAKEIAEEKQDDTVVKFGNPNKGYQWQNVFLPNATKLKIVYKSKEYFSDVRHQQIYYEGTPCSPSQFARRVANNTNRNAWNDIWLKRPNDEGWVFADRLRVG